MICRECNQLNPPNSRVCQYCEGPLQKRPNTVIESRYSSPSPVAEAPPDWKHSSKSFARPSLVSDGLSQAEAHQGRNVQKKIAQSSYQNHGTPLETLAAEESNEKVKQTNLYRLEEGRQVIGAVVIIGPSNVQAIPLFDRLFRIGRDEEADICVQDQSVSSFHGSLLLKNERYRYFDNSRNGSLVDGNKVHEDIVSISNGSEIQMGSFLLRIFLHKDKS